MNKNIAHQVKYELDKKNLLFNYDPGNQTYKLFGLKLYYVSFNNQYSERTPAQILVAGTDAFDSAAKFYRLVLSLKYQVYSKVFDVAAPVLTGLGAGLLTDSVLWSVAGAISGYLIKKELTPEKDVYVKKKLDDNFENQDFSKLTKYSPTLLGNVKERQPHPSL